MGFTVRLELNNKVGSDGRHAIMLRLTKDRKLARLRTPFYVKKSDFNPKGKYGRWIRATEPKHAFLNIRLREYYDELLEHTEQLLSKRNLAAKEIVKRFKEEPVEQDYDWISYFKSQEQIYLDTGKARYSMRLAAVRKKLQAFFGDSVPDIRETNLDLMDGFKAYLHHLKNSTNTINHNLKIIKAIYRRAIKDEIVDTPNQKVLLYSLQSTSVERDKLTEEEVLAMKNAEIKSGIWPWHARNFFLFSFYMAGIRFSDFAELRWKNVVDGTLRYKMQKTGKLQQLQIHPRAEEILAIYRPDNPEPEEFIFPLLPSNYFDRDQVARIRISGAKNALVNKSLKDVAHLAGIKKNLSFHVARHSFAYIGYSKTKDAMAIKDALQHSKLKETQEYIKSLANDGERNTLGEIFD